MVETRKVEEFEAPSLGCVGVTVYTDRAEVKRAIKLQIHEGKNEVVVKKLPESVDPDSIRVEGTGKAVITEVQFQIKHINVNDDEELKKTKRNALNGQLQSLEKKMEKVNTGLRRLNRKREVLDGIAQQISSGKPLGSEKELGSMPLAPGSLEELDKYLSHYESRVEKVDEEILSNSQESKDIQQEIDLVRMNLREIGGYRNIEISREVSVILEGKEADAEVELILSYVVDSCGWVPSYDVRVFTEDKAMKIQYYGQVTQNTGEDWKDTKLFLSTATPNIGGQVPELQSWKVSFVPERPPVAVKPGRNRRMAKPKLRAAMAGPMRYNSLAPVEDAQESTEELAFNSIPMAQTTAKESVVSTNFEIARETTIPSDGTSHKVNVAVIDLSPEFEYVTIPRKTAYAYLKAKVLNKSPYPLLPGNVAVFLDNNFVAKSALKSVSPMEEFSVSLGVDPAIRVDYKPIHKFSEEAGMFTKSSIVTHLQKISIKNTRQEKIHILLIDLLPQSTDEKIKINVLEPTLPRESSEKSPVTLNKDKNLEWTLDIKEGEEKTVSIKYSIECPKGKELQFSEEKIPPRRGSSFSST